MRASLAFFIILATSHTAFPLDVDPVIQRCAEKIFGQRAGCVIIVEPRSGKLLGVTNPDVAFCRSFPPGSLFKIVTAFALLEEGRLDPHEQVFCKNLFRLQGRTFTCCDPAGHGKVDLLQAIAMSCSVFFYTEGQRLTPEVLCKFASDLGLGHTMGIGYPGESGGVLRQPACGPEFTQMLVGEGGAVRITPWQAALLLRKILLGKGDSYALVRDGLKMAARQGTARKASPPGICIAAKTGTATDLKFPTETHAWFAGFAPSENPEIILVIFLYRGKSYNDAAPLARRFFQEIIPRRRAHF